VVFLDRAIQDLDTNLVYFDNGKTVEYLTQRLIDNGLSKIGLIVGPKEYSSEQHCIDGFKHAFAKNGLALGSTLGVIYKPIQGRRIPFCNLYATKP
jgi:DNA-binding LacI/PurR family transcriptional regulator